MPFTVNFEQHCFEDKIFAWSWGDVPPGHVGFDESAFRDPLAAAGRSIAAAIATVGFDVPGIDVRFHTSRDRDGHVRVNLCSVTGEHNGVPFHFGYWRDGLLRGAAGPDGGDLEIGANGIASSFICGDVKIEDNDERPRKPLSAADMDVMDDMVLNILARIESVGLERYGDHYRDPAFRSRVAVETVDAFMEVRPITAPDDFPVLYAWRDMQYVRKDEIADDIVLTANGVRLIAFSDNDPAAKNMLHHRVHDGFDYASTDPTVKADQGTHTVREESVPVAVKLKWLNEVYVVDMGARRAERRRQDALCEAEGRDRRTDGEFKVLQTAAALTMVPVSEYGWDFEEPVFVIGRTIRTDEARFMKGVVALDYDGETLAVSLKDEESGVVVPLQSSDHPTAYNKARFVRFADDVARRTDSRATVERKLVDEMQRARILEKPMGSVFG